MMKFTLLPSYSAAEELMALQQQHPLLRRLGSDRTDSGHGQRLAVVSDQEDSVLAILQQTFPFQKSPVQVSHLVVCSKQGLRRLLAFLRRLLGEARPWLTAVTLTPQDMHIVLDQHSGLALQDVETLLTEQRFNRQVASSGGASSR